jgi:adenine-specific DNA-methyltransferase
MSEANATKFDKLVTLLKELFQLDQPDLDFGIYRIMHAKAGEVTQFLEKDLLPQVKDAFATYKSADKVELQKELEEMEAALRRAKVEPEQSSEVRALRERIANESVDIGALENEVYDHLYSFFRRYYSEGDFLAKRVYKPGVYAIPYEGEEVTLHWANKDQYYIKTNEYLRDYAFRLRPENETNPMRVHFHLVDAVEGEHGNVKAAEGKDRVFVLAEKDFITLEKEELRLNFEYRPATLTDWPEDQRGSKNKPPTQKELTAAAAQRIQTVDHTTFADWIADLTRPHTRTDGEPADYNRLVAHLNRYTARNTFDYFIHKDLGGFLKRELDFYIKNEVMHLDDVENESAPKVEQYLSKIKVIRKIAGKIIAFLAQLENFQKKLWLKKKFVVGTDWCITLGVIPETYLPEIVRNDAQREEWIKLFAIDQIVGDAITPAYSAPLSTAFLKANPTLVLDTHHFSGDFSARLVEALGELESQLDGLLVHSENFQALTLLQARYCGQVKCIYIDPPYNTGGDGFSYKDSYQHSSWLSMIEDRVRLGAQLLQNNASHFSSIDDRESHRLRLTLDEVFGESKFIADIVWQKRYAPDIRTAISDAHEYVLAYATNPELFKTTRNKLALTDAQTSQFKNPDNDPRGPWKADNFTAPGYRANQMYPITTPSGRVVRPPAGRCWGFTEPVFEKYVIDGLMYYGADGNGLPAVKRFLRDMDGMVPWTWWSHQEAGHSQDGLKQIMRLFGREEAFLTAKPPALIARVVKIASDPGSLTVDYFAGSGTTAHAVINLNREDNGLRRFALVEMGDHFEKVLLPRVKKVVFSPEWKDGKPTRVATEEEAKRSPRIIKVVRLEAFEDTLNNLESRRNVQQQSLLDTPQAQGTDKFKEQYLLRYQLDVESRGSQSLLNIAAFTDPTAYKLLVKHPGNDESRDVNVDLLETFNYLIGLTVQHMAAPRSFSAEFVRDSESRLQLKGRLKQEANGPWWFRTVTGTTPEGRHTLVIWRKLTGDAEQDNLVLETWFKDKQAYSVHDTEFDLIYVNGDNTLENLRVDPETWKVRLIEEDFQRLMFEGTEA